MLFELSFNKMKITPRASLCLIFGILLQVASYFLFFQSSLFVFLIGTWFASNFILGGFAMIFGNPYIAGKNKITGQLSFFHSLFWWPGRMIQLLLVFNDRFVFVVDTLFNKKKTKLQKTQRCSSSEHYF